MSTHARTVKRRTTFRWMMAGLLVAMLAAVPLGRAAAPAEIAAGQRIDMKVLLLSADGSEPGFGAWQAALDREGVPYDTFVAYTGDTKTATLTDEKLADYGADRAKYQAVILASGDLGRNQTNRNQTTSYLSALTDAEWAALARFERTFAIRQISDYTAPSPAHGLNVSGGASQDGKSGTLTEAGRTVFPYLKGPIPVADDSAENQFEAFGYEGTPVNPADWQTLVAAPTANSAYLGVFTHPEDGREEMVMTLASNQYQSHNQALRHGMLNWATRGVFLGYQRSYLELDVDDVFLGDDKWDPTLNVTNYDFESAIRMTPQDVVNAVAWQKRTGLKLNMVYNAGGVALYGGPTGDPLLQAFRASKNEFPWINHTLDHPNLDCTTQQFTQSQLTQNQAQFNMLLGPVSPGLNDPGEAVTGEHSGLANLRPGNPGTIDPPSFDELTETTGTLPAGTYEYAITARSAAGETVASTATTDPLPAGSGITATFNAVCHAVAFNLYRRPAGGSWLLVGTRTRGARDPIDNGTTRITYSITDNGGAGTAAELPTTNGAALTAYAQNPGYIPALAGAGIATVATDASKAYPNPPGKTTGLADGDPTNYPKGATFPLVNGIQAVPRYPTNVYYNVANRADQLDEYNWIYTAPPTGGCVPIAQVTTCNTAPVTWDQYLNSETRIMLGHLAGNDPRPHYFHQTNIAQSDLSKATTDTTVGGTLYALIDTVLARYDAVYDRASAPLLQLPHRQVAATLVQQDTWAATRAGGKLSAFLRDGVVHITNTGTAAVDVPITGTTAGTVYGGQRSGWISVAPGTTTLQSILPKGRTRAAPPATAPAKKKAGKRVPLKLKRVRMHPKRFAVAHKRPRLGTRLDGAAITWRLNKRATVKLKFQRRKRSGNFKQVGTITRKAPKGAGVVRFRGRFGKHLLKPGRYRVKVSAQRKGERAGPKKVAFKVKKP